MHLALIAEAEGFAVELHIGDAGGGAGHAHGKVVANFNRDLTAGHVHGDVTVAEADAVCDGSGSATAGAGGEGIASAAFPDLNLNVIAVDDFQELHVGAVREGGVDFDDGAVLAGECFGDFRKWHDAVRVADVGKIYGVVGAVDHELLADVLVGLLGAIDRDVVHREADFAHIDGDRCCAITDFTGDDSTEGIDGEGIVFHFADIVEVAGEDAQAVAAFLGFAAVGVHNAQAEVGFVGGKRSVEDAVGAEAEITVANAHGVLLVGQLCCVFRIEDEVVVPEGVVFCEFHND